MPTRLATILIAGCALIGPAHAFDFTADQATRTLALAMMASENCPGMKLNFDKVGKILVGAGITTDAITKDAVKPVIDEYMAQFGKDRAAFCDIARDPTLPIHLMLDID